MKIFAVILLYVVCSAFSYAALLAEAQSYWADVPGGGAKTCRRQAGAALGISLIPIGGELAAIFLTGFVEHGLKWTCP